ncbi:MAG: site-specific DNA-methyltransferase [Endomicrobium sp.]|jgi:DNA modification methylase|nr:site-specific DNA-methyltransferase [Endomicrobium sp.]
MKKDKNIHYLDIILSKSQNYLKTYFLEKDYLKLMDSIKYIYKIKNTEEIVSSFCQEYHNFVKFLHQKKYKYNDEIDSFINKKSSKKIIWGDCYEALRQMKNESIHCMVTSPPYYNAREYSQWDNLDNYFKDMEKILKECYRVLDNHRVFVFNVGDIFDNDNLCTKSVWGKRRLPLGAYFINLFEKIGFTFVDDIIWDKGEVQSERHKNGDRPYPFYQYPMNCYEHILVFHKHRLDMTRYPCPICGTLQVNGNSYTEKGLKSWECKNADCFVRSEANRGKRFSVKTYNTQSNIKNKGTEISKDFIYSWRRDIKRLNPVIKINSKRENVIGHSAPFPKEIPEFAVKMFSYINEKVLDPFSGVGTSVKMASELDREGIGIEKDLTIKKNVYHFIGKENLLEFGM